MLLKLDKLGSENKYIRKILVTLLCVFTCIVAVSCGKNEKSNADKNVIITDEDKLIVDFINVGKGDCMLIQSREHTYIIDTGYEETKDSVIDFLDENNISVIDGIIITHFDKDHIGGASAIIKKYDVKEIFMPDYVGEGNKYKKFMEKLEKWNKMNLIHYVTDDLNIEFDDIKMEILPPLKSEYLKENDYSLVTKLTYNEDTFLFTGDAEEERVNELLGDERIKALVLKVPYHGHMENNSIQFIDEVLPKYAVITSDSESEISSGIIYELIDIGSKYFFNCNGNIRCVSFGDGNPKFTQ